MRGKVKTLYYGLGALWSFGNLQEDQQSCMHQKCVRLSLMYQKKCCTSGVCGFWSYCYTSYVFLHVWLDQQWLTNLKMLKGFVEALLEFHFIWHCAGFWLSLLEEQSNDCSVWLTVPTDFLQIVPFFLQSPQMWRRGFVSWWGQTSTLSHLLSPVYEGNLVW